MSLFNDGDGLEECHDVESAPVHQVVIIGAGPGGLGAAIELGHAGIDDVVLLERSDRVGGTWWLNHYPGLECDIASHLYSFSFELKRNWTRPYATQPEIHTYLEHCAHKYDVVRHIRFKTSVRRAVWDERAAIWRITTDHDEEIRARVLVSAIGMFNGLAWPDIPGIDQFEGASFHSGRWDHSHDLTGETVAVIGSAASAVQFIPEIAETTGRLLVFQRSAQWVLPKADAPYTPDQLATFVNDDTAAPAFRDRIFREVDAIMTFSNPEFLATCVHAGLENIEVVEDPEVRAKLTPTVPYGCQRPLQSNRYFPTFNRPDVELSPSGSWRSRATASSPPTVRRTRSTRSSSPPATPRLGSWPRSRSWAATGSRSTKAWSDGANAYLGITTHGFPNLFMLYGPNTNNGSIIYMLECQAAYVARQVARMRDEHIAWMDVRREVEEAYVDQITRDLAAVEVWGAACHNYYRAESGRIVTQWPHSMSEYQRRTEAPDADAYDVARSTSTSA